jgi:hypothetical protein
LARIDVTAALQQVEPARHPFEDLRRGEDARPRSRELDRERQVVQTAAELGHGLVRLEPGARREELDRICLGEREHRVLHLAANAQQLSRRDEQLEIWTGLEQLCELGRALDHLLHVVEEEQQLALGHVLGEAVLRAERLRDRPHDERRLVQRGEPDPEDAAPEIRDELGGSLDREPCLAGTAGAAESNQAGVADDRDHLGHLPLPPDEARHRTREVRVRDRLERREGLVAELVDPHRLREVLQPMLAEVDHGQAVDQLARRPGEHHLAPVCGRRYARSEMDVLPDVPLGGEQRGSRVQPEADVDRAAGELLDRLRRGRDRLRRLGEHEEERVPLGIHLRPAACREDLPQHAPVVGDRKRVPVRA